MAYSRRTHATPRRPTTVYGVLLRIIPGDFRLQVEIQRAPDSAGSPDTGSAVTVTTAGPFGRSGGLWADRRPNNGARWHYRIRHVSPNLDAGPWSGWLNAIPYKLEPEELAAAESGADIYPINRSIAMSDGEYTLVSSTSDGLTAKDTVKESGGKEVRRLYAKPLAADPDTIDSVNDGTTHRRLIAAAVNNGRPKDPDAFDAFEGSDRMVPFLRAEPGNLVDNSDFEQGGSTAGGSNTGWSSRGSGGTLAYETSSPISGSRSLRVDTNGTASEAGVQARKYVVCRAGDKFMLRAKGYKSASGVAASYLRVLWINAAGSEISAGNGPAFTTSLAEHVAVVTAPANAVRARLNCFVAASGAVGSVYFDEIRLERALHDELPVMGRVPGMGTIITHIADTGHAASTMQESGGKEVRRLLAKTVAGDVDSIDGVPEGTTYKRTHNTALNTSGYVDFSKSGFANKSLDNVGDGSTWKRVANVTGGNRVPWNGQDERSQRSDNDSDASPYWVRILTLTGANGRGSARVRIASGGSGASPGYYEFHVGVNYGAEKIIKLVAAGGSLSSLVGVRLIQDDAGGASHFDVQLSNTSSATFVTQVEAVPGSGYSSWSHVWTKAPSVPGGSETVSFDCSDRPTSGSSYRSGATTRENIGKFGVDGRMKMNNAEVVTQAGHVESRVQESGGKTVNRLYAKTLAADVDNQDSVADGTTYKKVLGVSSGLITPSSSSGRNRCRVSNSSGTSVSDSTNTTLSWDTEAFDTGALHDTGTNPERITVPTGGNVGIWVITAQVQWASNATGFRQVQIYKNGAATPAQSMTPPVNGDNTAHTAIFHDDAPSAGDYYTVVVRQNSGGNLSTVLTGTFFSAAHLW